MFAALQGTNFRSNEMLDTQEVKTVMSILLKMHLPRRLVVLGSPLVLVVVLSTHPVLPQNASVFRGILPRVDWWLTLHLLQLPLFGLLALAVYLLTKDVHGIASSISRVALACFVIFYLPFDSLLGISTGILVRYGAGLPSAQQAILEKALDTFVQNPLINLVSILGSLGWQVGVLAAALALSHPSRSRLLVMLLTLGVVLSGVWSLLTGFVSIAWWVIVLMLSITLGLASVPRLAVTFLVLASLLFGASHVPPFGPLGLTCFFVAVLQLELFQQKQIHEAAYVPAPSFPTGTNNELF